MCSDLTCGAVACSSAKTPTNGSIARAIDFGGNILIMPEPQQPQTDDTFDYYMVEQTRQAYAIVPSVTSWYGKYGTSAAVKTYDTDVGSLALGISIWGCTSVVIISERGAYMNHIWQRKIEDTTRMGLARLIGNVSPG